MNLHLLQLGDSALPIGGYSHSWGLEAAIEQGIVRDAESLEQWVRHWLRDLVGPFEGVLVAAACHAAQTVDWPKVVRSNDLLRAGLAPPTLRHASRDMGEQLLQLAEAWPWASDAAAALRRTMLNEDQAGEWHHAIVFGTLAAAAGSSESEAAAVYLHQAALGCISAGVRAVPIGHTHGQQILAVLHDELAALAGELATRELETAGSFAPAYEVLCHAQANLYTRIFRS
ncbi:MAG TPA: urease accessory UreF family protein [Gemmataceae bacterium]|jgi:urease accessory protein|nr:urease accessory UreF family protein [Gemmataceae bacterium]